jgi:Arc/MetJ family transcription regulator
MKTTIDISDALLTRAKKLAQRTGKPLRALVEDGLRRVLESETKRGSYELPDRSVGDKRAANPLDALSWQDLRDQIYGGR